MSWIGPLIRRCRTNKRNGRSYGLGTGPDEVIVHKVARKTWQITLISEPGWMPTVVEYLKVLLETTRGIQTETLIRLASYGSDDSGVSRSFRAARRIPFIREYNVLSSFSQGLSIGKTARRSLFTHGINGW